MTRDTKAFLQALTGQTNPEVTAATFTDCKDNRPPTGDPLTRTYHGPIEGLDPELRKLNKQGAGVFYTVNKTDRKGRKKENITKVRTVWQDDDSGYGWPDGYLIAPNAVVHTSEGEIPKFQRLFFTDTTKLNEFDAVQSRLIADHGSDPSATGIARLLRLPGYYHMKNPGKPFMVTVIGEINHRRHSWETIKAIFPPVAITKPSNQHPPGNGTILLIGRIYAALKHIPADDYTTWLHVGMGLHHESGGGAEGLWLWDQWSKKSNKYRQGVCKNKWHSFGKN